MNFPAKILLLYKDTATKTLDYMVELAAKDKVQLELGQYNTLNILLQNNQPMQIYLDQTPIQPGDFQVIYSRTERTFLIDCLDKVLTRTQFLQVSKPHRKTDKFWQYASLHQHHIPIPKTFGFFLTALDRRISFIEQEFSYPMVVKGVAGAHGSNVYLAHSRSELFQICQENFDLIRPILIQEYIENLGDYRVIVIDYEYKTSFLRQAAEGQWKNNTSLGGQIIPQEIPIELRAIASKSCQILDYPLGGVDIMIPKHNPKQAFVLEVNPSFQITSNNGEYKQKAKYVTDYLVKIAKAEKS